MVACASASLTSRGEREAQVSRHPPSVATKQSGRQRAARAAPASRPHAPITRRSSTPSTWSTRTSPATPSGTDRKRRTSESCSSSKADCGHPQSGDLVAAPPPVVPGIDSHSQRHHLNRRSISAQSLLGSGIGPRDSGVGDDAQHLADGRLRECRGDLDTNVDVLAVGGGAGHRQAVPRQWSTTSIRPAAASSCSTTSGPAGLSNGRMVATRGPGRLRPRLAAQDDRDLRGRLRRRRFSGRPPRAGDRRPTTRAPRRNGGSRCCESWTRAGLNDVGGGAVRRASLPHARPV